MTMIEHPTDNEDYVRVSKIIDFLYMGGRPDTYIGFDLVVNCENYITRKPMQGWENTGVFIHIPLQDTDDLEIPEDVINKVSDLVMEFVLKNKTVLVHCTAGFNRSALVVVRAVQKIMGYTPKEAVALMRVQRDELVLCNRHFEKWALNTPTITAENSMFNSIGEE